MPALTAPFAALKGARGQVQHHARVPGGARGGPEAHDGQQVRCLGKWRDMATVPRQATPPTCRCLGELRPGRLIQPTASAPPWGSGLALLRAVSSHAAEAHTNRLDFVPRALPRCGIQSTTCCRLDGEQAKGRWRATSPPTRHNSTPSCQVRWQRAARAHHSRTPLPAARNPPRAPQQITTTPPVCTRFLCNFLGSPMDAFGQRPV